MVRAASIHRGQIAALARGGLGSSCLDDPCNGSNSANVKGIFETELTISTLASPDARQAPKEGSQHPNFRENVGYSLIFDVL